MLRCEQQVSRLAALIDSSGRLPKVAFIARSAEFNVHPATPDGAPTVVLIDDGSWDKRQERNGCVTDDGDSSPRD